MAAAEIALTKKKKTMTSSPLSPDHISNLPDQILISILSLLETDEAAATTVLSKRWARLFRSIPDLSFTNSDKVTWIACLRDNLNRRTDLVHSIQMVTYSIVEFKDDFDDILRSLCRLGIKNLLFRNYDDQYLVPSFIFSCRTVTSIELRSCMFSLPAKFTGLPQLRKLYLHECRVEDDQLENLISCCSVLEELIIQNCCGLRNVVIRANKLATLTIYAYRRRLNISIVNAPCLDKVGLQFDMNGKFEEPAIRYNNGVPAFLQHLTNIQTLILIISAENTELPAELRVPKSFPAGTHLSKLKILSLRLDFSLGCAIHVFSCLLLSCPMLGELQYIVTVSKSLHYPDYWRKHPIPRCMVNQLRNVTLSVDFNYQEHWIELVKFILKNASVLQEFIIYKSYRIRDCATHRKITEELMLMQKASADVSIVVDPPLRGRVLDVA